MRKSLATAVLVIVVAALAALVALPAFAATPVFNGTVGPGFTIKPMKKKPTKAVRSQARGRRQVEHPQLPPKGPGVNVKTSVGIHRHEAFTVTLKKGKVHVRVRPARDLDARVLSPSRSRVFSRAAFTAL